MPTLTREPSPSQLIDPAADYRIAPPHTLTPDDVDVDEEPAEVERIVGQLRSLFGNPSLTVEVGFRIIDEQMLPANFRVIRFPSGILGQAGTVERILAVLPCCDQAKGKLGTLSIRGKTVVVERLQCIGEMDPGSVCFVAGYARGDDLVWINSNSTKPLAFARALAAAVISATP